MSKHEEISHAEVHGQDWKPWPNEPRHYRCSIYGLVASNKCIGGLKTWRILNPYLNNNRLITALSIDNATHHYQTARMVLSTFNPYNPRIHKGESVVQLDGNHENIELSNLAWGTQAQAKAATEGRTVEIDETPVESISERHQRRKMFLVELAKHNQKHRDGLADITAQKLKISP